MLRPFRSGVPRSAREYRATQGTPEPKMPQHLPGVRADEDGFESVKHHRSRLPPVFLHRGCLAIFLGVVPDAQKYRQTFSFLSLNPPFLRGKSSLRRTSGFTLIEVLVASVILFAGLGAILRAYSMAVSALDSASDVLVTSAWLRDRAAAIELQVKAGEGALSGGGRTRLEGREYLWEVDAREQSVTPDVKLQAAVISITRSPSGTPHFLQSEWALFRDPSIPSQK
jgi:hypothetical protein